MSIFGKHQSLYRGNEGGGSYGSKQVREGEGRREEDPHYLYLSLCVLQWEKRLVHHSVQTHTDSHTHTSTFSQLMDEVAK